MQKQRKKSQRKVLSQNDSPWKFIVQWLFRNCFFRNVYIFSSPKISPTVQRSKGSTSQYKVVQRICVVDCRFLPGRPYGYSYLLPCRFCCFLCLHFVVVPMRLGFRKIDFCFVCAHVSWRPVQAVPMGVSLLKRESCKVTPRPCRYTLSLWGFHVQN